MKVLHVVHQYLPEQIGGTELYTQWLTHGLRQRGHQVSIFYRRDAEGKGLESWEDEQGVQIWAAWCGRLTPNRRFLATFGERDMLHAFRQVVEQTQPDLVHVQHLMALPAAVVHYIQKKGLPFIITLHDYWWVCANAQLLTNYSQQVCEGPRAYLNCARCALARSGHPRLWPALPAMAILLAWRNRLLRQIVGAASRLIAPAKFVGDWYARHGVPTERLSVIPHGLDLPAQVPQRKQRSDGSLRFAYIGGLSWQKGVHVLLEAFSGIKQGGDLWVAGDESADPDYISRLRHQTLPGVRFLGKLTREEVWETLAQVDVVVVPSMWYETFSFIVSEAFAAGVPVVASRLGPLADRVRDGVDGLLVPPGDSRALQNALRQFMENPALLPQLRAGIRPVRTMDDYVAEIESVYRAVLAQAT
jgi:glycosyltransferase involved in cell wall biosynthesis